MIKQIEKNEIFNHIMNDHDVYCVDLNNVEIKWANEMTIDGIKEKIANGYQFIIDEKTRAVGFSGHEMKRIDINKFHQKLHDENITKTELANLSGVNINTIWNISKGSRPRQKTLDKVCKVLKCSAEDLLEE